MKILCLLLLATSVTGRFTDDLYQLLAKNSANKNLITSPLSVDIALGMAYMGAGGNTAREMRDVLKLPADKKEVARKYKQLLTNLEGREKAAMLHLANRIYVNDRFTINPEFNQVVKDSFKAEAKAISVSDPKRAASIVNKWVSDQTRSRIKTLVGKEDMGPHLVMVLLNAIYFKGQWQRAFNSTYTKRAHFRTADKQTVPVQMMEKHDKFKAGYVHSLGAKVIELPYRNSTLSMVIFLPEKVDGLPELERKIAGFSPELREQEVILKLPKFKIEFSSELKGTLSKMGMRDAFSGEADFGGLVKSSNPRFSKVIHKAFLEVSEEGAEAAAATAVLFGVSFLSVQSQPPRRILEINADHPFAYVIRDKDTIYFQGHFVKPEK
ncbi:serine protease inhibitor 42Dd-like isoform X1 [Drosophila biarmipes]|uniref:serine protease inhibitor 42Dd-like isoform X1 n=1 Tax=Drosophila biarmipes TaxID=125945 RepID=UPI001CDA9FA8|nr:serine protease inhibitor 42Dd-like isoform X1 [Drosophila biarmipes]